MRSKIRVGILFGGQSVEHEISIISARSIYETIDREKFEVVLIGIDRSGGWHFSNDRIFIPNGTSQKLKSFVQNGDPMIFIPGRKNETLMNLNNQKNQKPIDVIFPVLHGTNGEDGTIQGLLKLSGIPFVGAGVLGSAIGMDKEVSKRLLREAKIPIPHFRVLRWNNKNFDLLPQILNEFDLPFFVKPAHLGSSVGVSKVKTSEALMPAIEEAFLYDNKILVEECISGREIECSVLGNENPIASLPGEVKPQHEFYSYEAKYLDENGAILEIPARLPQECIQTIQETAIKTFQILEAEGMARIDFFLKENGKLYVNEINTIPGFTQISMYPKLWEASGLSYQDLITRLIELALERAERDRKLKITYEK